MHLLFIILAADATFAQFMNAKNMFSYLTAQFYFLFKVYIYSLSIYV